MSLPVSPGPRQPAPATGITTSNAVMPPLVPNGPNASPPHASLAAGAPTMTSKVPVAVAGADLQRMQRLSAFQPPAPAQQLNAQPAAQLPAPLSDSEPRLVDLAHPIDQSVTRADPPVQDNAGLASNPNGKVVRLDLGAYRLTQKDLRRLARQLSSAQCKLEALCLSECTIYDETAKELAHALRGNDSLKTFSLRAASLMPTGWTYLTTALAAGWPCIGAMMEGRRFETLVLESARAGEVPLHLLRSIVRDNRRLRELVIASSAKCEAGPTVPEEDWNEELFQFCEALKKNDSLFVLDLSCYRFTAASLDQLILALDAHPAIEVFCLGANILTREQADRIAAIVARNALANHARHDAPAAAALDLLVPASCGFAAGSIWPRELSNEIAGQMDGRTLLSMPFG